MAQFDQRDHWNRIYQDPGQSPASDQPSPLARQVSGLLPDGARILELGCGDGRDAAFFARAGHTVTAVDFSDVAIARNRAAYLGVDHLVFAVADLSERLPFKDAAFDLVYARLSLHYFRDTVTKRLFGEMWRILEPTGLLSFQCKSIRDPLYGRGESIEPDMFMRNGHVRHFYSAAYAQACLGTYFEPIAIEADVQDPTMPVSSFVKVIARKASTAIE